MESITKGIPKIEQNIFLIATTSYIIFNTLIQFWINKSVEHWEHDEYYHISHAVQFYNADYSYNKFITTPPGLYLLGKLYLHIVRPINYVLNFEVDEDYHTYIRYLNASVLGGINFILLYKIVEAKYQEKNIYAIFTFVLSVIFIPIYYPMHVVFYTEIGSMSYLLLTYYLVLVRKVNQRKLGKLLLILVGICAFGQRQTNIIWINYIAIIGFINNYEMQFKSILSNLVKIISENLWLAVIDLMFIYFYIWNGNSIVIGDRDSHPLVLHYAQLLYSLLFLIVCIPVPFHTKVFQIVEDIFQIIKLRRPFKTLAFLILNGIAYLMVLNGTFTHKFIESNRGHYSFEFNKIVIKNEQVQFALVPLYSILTISLYEILAQTQGPKAKYISAIFLVASAMTLFPCQLFELRYFLHPVFLVSLEMFNPRRTKMEVWLGALAYMNFYLLHEYRDHPFWFHHEHHYFL
ncbi:dol-p-glc:glc man c-pp-dol alpha--glucosyltransferase [Stylonychia lemnae]|uniref:Dol-P-Glc:Glc(2)Man(9)GlcNAc(2)-PP-Dol alpha-1,2-glucosyltransferase n=1 Tax=Stylonychia lemnae TaxID=5949 RepID=A0A078ALJ6_STYLE|nr:dol-p-glc:glc man c-pp-dol alpha--glucosyltransferase [Stylonychia lemnae]|eukprot:CDW83230.1 dol-p-glc:glc man c-pp-dol alpha--glucosyltransferase [Stylonychia lemnae]